MPKPIPHPPGFQPPQEARDLLDRARDLTDLPDGATPEQHAEAVASLQWLQNEILDEWLRALARAQGSGAVSHRRLVEVTGYKAHRNVQERVYQGRALLHEKA